MNVFKLFKNRITTVVLLIIYG